MCFVPVILLSFSSYGQRCIMGKISHAVTGQVIHGANITIPGVSGTASDHAGHFEICAIKEDTIELRVSYMGFETLLLKQVVVLSDFNSLDLKLFPSSIVMDEIVVTATRTENQLLQTPVRVNLLSSRLIQTIPSYSIDEVLRFVPGVNWSRPFGIFSTKATVTMRGLSGKEQGRVMVLLDGVPVNKSDGGTVDWNMINMEQVKKVEVTKGAGSALYGGNAMGGVINIISSVPVERFTAGATLEYGSYNTAGARLNAGGRVSLKSPSKYFYWNASTRYRQSDGYITQSEVDVLANPYIIKSNLKEFGINLKGGYIIGDKHRIDAMMNYYDDHRGTGEKVFLEDGNVTDHDSYGFTVNYLGTSGKVKIRTSLYSLTEHYKKVNEYKKDNYTWYNVLSKRNDMGLLSNFSRPFGSYQVLTGGIDYRNGSVDAYDKYFTSTDIVYNKGNMHNYALFIQDEISMLNSKVKLIAGIRYDLATFYDGSFRIESPSLETSFMENYQVPEMPQQNWNAWSPRLSLQYRPDERYRIYAMVSRGFRPSVLDDLCRSGRIKGGFKLANPALQPEYLSNFETGFDILAIRNITISASGYYSRGKDFHYFVSNGQTIDMGFGDRPVFIRANISDVEITGFEAETRWEAGSSFMMFANYGYSRSIILNYKRISDNDTIDLSGKYFTDVPEHIISSGINWNHSILNGSILYRFTGPMFINDRNTLDEVLQMTRYPGYSTLDLKIWKQLFHSLKVTVSIQNLFDTKYYDSKYAVCPGRFITASVTYKFP